MQTSMVDALHRAPMLTAKNILLLLVVGAFSLVHVFGGRLVFLSAVPRSAWLSGAGGVAVAYVFVHLLPELAVHQQALGDRARDAGVMASLESHAYLIALAGLVLFYGIERFARTALQAQGDDDGERTPLPVFWFHLWAFAFYNVLIGYLLIHREESDVRGLIIYAVAMTMHFLVNDQGLRQQHGTTYHLYGRWILAAAPAAGALLGVTTDIASPLLSAMFAMLAGGIILNVLKEELPAEQESRFSAFLLGAAAYATLLVLSA